MRVDSLFTFVDAPDLNAVVDEPFDHERRFFGSSANTVKHEHQQNIEFTLFGIFLDELNFITVIGADLEAWHAVFLFLVHDGPAHPLCELTAGFSLHGDVSLILVIVVDLLGGGDAVQTAYSVLDAEYILIRTTNSFSHNVSFLSMNDLEMWEVQIHLIMYSLFKVHGILPPWLSHISGWIAIKTSKYKQQRNGLRSGKIALEQKTFCPGASLPRIESRPQL